LEANWGLAATVWETMTRPAIVRLRALGLLAAVLTVAAGALWIGGASGDVAAVQHPGGLVFADPDQAAVVSPAADAKTTSGWIMPLAALGAAVAIALRFFARRDPQSVRASFAVKRRLVHACRRAPPRMVVTPLF
jgi:hypothetical protein